MIEYNKILKFKYNKNYYQLLLDNQNRYFFLKINYNNTYSYVTFEEYLTFLQIFCRKYNNSSIKFDKKKFTKKLKVIPKVILGGCSILITSTLLLSSFETSKFEKKYNEYLASYEYTEDIELNISHVVEDKNEDLTIDKYVEGPSLIYIYDNSYLSKFLNYETVSKEEMLNELQKNTKINEKFKQIISSYINDLFEKYPTMDKRIFFENLKTLEIVECTKSELLFQSLSPDSSACYKMAENKIYTLKDYEYEKNTLEWQTIYHELSHVAGTLKFKSNGKNITATRGGKNMSLVIVDEALNSLFAVSLFDYEEKDISYQLQSNYCKIMLECLDNYTLQDYMEKSLSYFASKLDEYNEDNNYATTMLNLMDAQFKAYHNDKIEIEQEEFYPLYDYIADMYYNKYITNNMNYREAKVVADTLIDSITFDVPDEYNIDTNRFYYRLEKYCELLNIPIENYNKSM